MGRRRAQTWLMMAAGLGVAACSPAAEEPRESETAAPGISDDTLAALAGDEATGDELVSFAVPDEELITGEGIGVARPGDTLGALQTALGAQPVRFEPEFMVDLSAVCVEGDDGSELYCAAFVATDQPAADTEILMVATRHPRFRTQAGVGPGVRLEDAEAVYGEAFLNYNIENESREYVEFDQGPAGSIAFRPLAPSARDGFAGLYGEPGDEEEDAVFFETEDYRPDTVIASVEVHAPVRR